MISIKANAAHSPGTYSRETSRVSAAHAQQKTWRRMIPAASLGMAPHGNHAGCQQ